ncbi:DUF1203 domain-containing protein [Paragemmobacter straminiformis]|uniref:DUF1203 domain-containing protein n=1 Tax=Paragemmobacter straminiformis TaxID=2045119 RepID=A0A842I360_9RHOB|nr:DUF1203 domain-containing protein [Gemmobacter straminiformis]MBC2834166.1 DUF1203 domain-containing protein [Gemmobacter straminiformis]
MTLRFLPIPTDIVRAYQAGGPDAYGLPPERRVSDGGGNPCRHCLRMIPAGAGMLVLAHRPFGSLQPYAETGPIFLCAAPCEAGGGEGMPEVLSSPDYIVRGYGPDERIVYGTGAVVPTQSIPARAAELLGRGDVACVHVRSARNNCFQLRIERA